MAASSMVCGDIPREMSYYTDTLDRPERLGKRRERSLPGFLPGRLTFNTSAAIVTIWFCLRAGSPTYDIFHHLGRLAGHTGLKKLDQSAPSKP